MADIEKIVSELKNMDKSKRREILSSLSRDQKVMDQVSGLLKDPELVKKLKELL